MIEASKFICVGHELHANWSKWAMIGGMLIIFLLIPESPWWLASKGKIDKAANVLQRFYGHQEGYNVDETIVSFFLPL